MGRGQEGYYNEEGGRQGRVKGKERCQRTGVERVKIGDGEWGGGNGISAAHTKDEYLDCLTMAKR